MLRFGRTWTFLAVSVVVFVLLAIGALLHILGKQDEIILGRDSEFPHQDVTTTPLDVASSIEHRPTTGVESLVNNGIADPRNACEDPLGELSDECMQSLDAYFLDMPFLWNDFDWVQVPMTYRRVFTDPEGDRERVFAALERPECRLEEGEIRWDLKESCEAASFANYANFIHFCQEAALGVTLQQESIESLPETQAMDVRRSTFESYEDWDDFYKRPSRWAGERLLEGRWIVEKVCKKHSARTLTWDHIRESPHFERLKSIGYRFEVFSDSWGSSSLDAMFYQLTSGSERWFGSSDAFNALRVLAARLGDEWAASVYLSTEEDDAWNAHEIESMPWKQSLRIMQAGIYWNRESLGIENDPSSEDVLGNTEYLDISLAMGRSFSHTGDKARISALAFGLSAWEELDRSGIEIDLDRLVKYICDPSWSKSLLNCQESIDKLSKTESSIDQYYWHRLSQFKTRSIELDLYDTEPSDWDPDWERKELGIAKPINWD